MENKDNLFMTLAMGAAALSPITSRKVGIVLTDSDGRVLATACNTLSDHFSFPPGTDIDKDEAKAYWVEHAERAAIYECAAKGTGLRGATMYSTLFPCASCMRAIVQSGIKTLVSPAPDMGLRKWAPEFEQALLLLQYSPLEHRRYVAEEVA